MRAAEAARDHGVYNRRRSSPATTDRLAVIHPDTELRWISPEIGGGVFATRPISHGTVDWVLGDLDHVLDATAVEALDEPRRRVVDKYAHRNQHGQYVLLGRRPLHEPRLQPGAHLIEPRFQARIRTAVEQEVLLDSIATTYCPPK